MSEEKNYCTPVRFFLVGWSRLGMQGHHSLNERAERYARSEKARRRALEARERYEAHSTVDSLKTPQETSQEQTEVSCDDEHRFVVTVSGCSAEEAEQVMNERIYFDESYGFDYTIEFEHQT